VVEGAGHLCRLRTVPIFHATGIIENCMTVEMHSSSASEHSAPDSKFLDVRDHFVKNGFAWSVGDMLLAGGSLPVLGDLLACVLNVHDTEGKRAVRRIVVVQPADPDGGTAVLSAIL
jgi:hypothetical protein